MPTGLPGRRGGSPIGPTDIWVAAGTDIVFRWPSLQLAAAHVARGSRAFVYLFDWESPAFGGILGSCHALELPFVFGAVHLPVVQVFSGGGPAVEALSTQMQRAWLAFAAAGDPSHDGIGAWSTWDPSHARHHGLRGEDRARGRATRRGAGRPGETPSARLGRARLAGTGADLTRWRQGARRAACVTPVGRAVSGAATGGGECRYDGCCASTPPRR